MKKICKILGLSLACAAMSLMVQAEVVYPAFEKLNPFDGIGMPRECGGNIWADYNGDGLPDVLIFGGTWGGTPTPRLFKNNGGANITFTETTVAVFDSAFVGDAIESSAVWLDYNKDGIIDLLLVGNINKQKGSFLYKGSGTGDTYKLTLDETLSAQLPQGITSGDFGSATARWLTAADYNNDGYSDILFGGKIGDSTVFALYRNDTTAFTLQDKVIGDTANFRQQSNGSVAWADYDKDGDLDILFNGPQAAGVYKNNGNGTFEEILLLSNSMKTSEVAWIDYDKDGWLDAVISGEGGDKKPDGTDGWDWYNIGLYHNNQDGTFTQVFNSGLGGINRGSIAVGDLNNDGWDDIILLGQWTNKAFFNNKGAEGNIFGERNSTLGLTSEITQSMVTILDVNNDNNLDICIVGNNLTPALFLNKYPEEDVPPVVVPPDSTIMFSRDTIGLPTAGFGDEGNNGGATWGDYDGDGKLDVLIWDRKNGAKVYKINDKGVFAHQSNALQSNFPKLTNGGATWFDYNADGLMDLVVAGKDGNDGDKPIAKVYRNGGYSMHYGVVEATHINTLRPMYSEKGGGDFRSLTAVADYNNDGYPDILMMGEVYKQDGSTNATYGTDDKGEPNGLKADEKTGRPSRNHRFVDLYKNVPTADGGRTFERQPYLCKNQAAYYEGYSGSLYPINGGSVAWGDYNNDGYQDILFSGWSDKIPGKEGGGAWAGIYKNKGDGTFDMLDIQLTGIICGDIAWIDINGDGLLDIVLTGECYCQGDNNAHAFWNVFVYKNNGNDSFDEVTNHGLSGLNASSVAVADLNGDGLSDIVMMGEVTYHVFYSNGDGTFKKAYDFMGQQNPKGTVNFVDYNNDGRLDVFAVGKDYTAMFKNESGPKVLKDNKPAAPTGLTASEKDGKLTLSWTASTTANVSYNLFLQMGEGKTATVIAQPLPMNFETGFLRVGIEGAALKRNTSATITVNGLRNGTYTWGVEAVSNGRAVSELVKSTATVTSGITGVSKAALGSFKAFKRGSVLVTSTDIAADNAELSVYSLTGAKLWSKQGCFLGETEISGLPQGFYFVVIRVGNEIMVEKTVN